MDCCNALSMGLECRSVLIFRESWGVEGSGCPISYVTSGPSPVTKAVSGYVGGRVAMGVMSRVCNR